jgi:glycosyltransferase involved in cell wall biosynthesis
MRMFDPFLSVIITCRDAADTIGDQLEALATQESSDPWELIVSDGGSTDGTLEIVESYKTRIPHLRLSHRQGGGAAHGSNVAAQEARGQAIAFVDADDVVAPGWVAAMAGALRTHDFVACRHDFTVLNEPWVRETRETHEPIQYWSWAPDVGHTCGSGYGIKRELHQAVGGFDESFPTLHDTDYCFRVQRELRTELVVAPDAVVHYRFRSRLGDIFRQATAYGESYALLQARFFGTWRPPGAWRWPLSGWRDVLRALPRVGSRAGRGRLAWTAGWQVGRLRGSLRHRVLAR